MEQDLVRWRVLHAQPTGDSYDYDVFHLGLPLRLGRGGRISRTPLQTFVKRQVYTKAHGHANDFRPSSSMRPSMRYADSRVLRRP